MIQDATKFQVTLEVWCPSCDQRHSLEIDLVDANKHRCSCCRMEFKLPLFAAIKGVFDKLAAGREARRKPIKGRVK